MSATALPTSPAQSTTVLDWQTPQWHWWWSPGLLHHGPALQGWLGNGVHQSITAVPDPLQPLFPHIHVFAVTVAELPTVIEPLTHSPNAVAVIFFDPLQNGIALPPHLNVWLVPWRPEQGVQHPRLIRLIQEIQQGIAMFPTHTAHATGTSATMGPLQEWLTTVGSRILSNGRTVILAEVGRTVWMARVVLEHLRQTAHWQESAWTVMDPIEVTARTVQTHATWLRPPETDRRTLWMVYGAESTLRQLAQELQKQPDTLWLWMPRPVQLAAAWAELVHRLPEPVHPIVWTRWAWQRFCSFPWPDDMQTVLQFWSCLINLTTAGALWLTAARVQLFLTGRVPAQTPEPLSNLIVSLLHERLQTGQTQHLLRDIETMFEQALLRCATRMFATLQDACKVLGISRTTLLRKIERYGIPNPWTK